VAASRLNPILRHVHRVALLRDEAEASDGQLLQRFAADRDEAAFAALVRRHGPMVLGVCRRVAGNVHDAEDAFQATFLVLARKAPSLRSPALLGNWLYGVAYRTALKAKTATARRRALERRGPTMPRAEPAPEDLDELRSYLDLELERLPEKYRVPVVLCELEGRSRQEVARLLRLPAGTLSSRLATARKRLARRLALRGLALSAGALALALTREATASAVPPTLAASTTQAAALFAAGAPAAGVLPAEVVHLAQGVLKNMMLSQLKFVAVLLAAGLCAAAVGLVGSRTSAAQQAEVAPPGLAPVTPFPTVLAPGANQNNDGDNARKDDSQKNQKDDGQQNQKDDSQQKQKDDGDRNQKDDSQRNQKDDGQQNHKEDGDKNQKDDGQQNQGVVKGVDGNKNTLLLGVKKDGKTVDRSFDLAQDVRVTLGGKPAALADLKQGTRVWLTLSGDRSRVVSVRGKAEEDEDENEDGRKGRQKKGDR
jgi:RNA polymerase sigma factor (sigma-70 family)